MTEILATLKPFVGQWGYWAVFAGLVLEDFGMPVPGEALLISAALLASQGQLHLVPLLLIAWAAAVMGDNIGFAIGHWGGRALIVRYGRYVLVTRERLERAEGFFRRHGGAVVAVARFIDVLRQLNGLIAGVVRMPWRRFLAYNALGAALWVGFWGTLSYLAGQRASQLLSGFRRFEYFLFGALALLIAVGAVRLYVRHRRSDDGRPSSG